MTFLYYLMPHVTVNYVIFSAVHPAKCTRGVQLTNRLFRSNEPNAHGEFIGWYSSRRPWVRACVRPFTFQRSSERSANQSQIVSEASIGRKTKVYIKIQFA